MVQQSHSRVVEGEEGREAGGEVSPAPGEHLCQGGRGRRGTVMEVEGVKWKRRKSCRKGRQELSWSHIAPETYMYVQAFPHV